MKLGVLLMAHKRAKTLEHVLSELERYSRFPDLQVLIHVRTDRPLLEVEEVLGRHAGSILRLQEARFPAVDENGEHWSEASNEQLQDFPEAESCDWLLRQDDDNWLEPLGATKEIPKALQDSQVDMWYAKSLFFWDKPGQINTRRAHLSPYFFRPQKFDRFPVGRDLRATAQRHDSAIMQGRLNCLATPLLDYGSFDMIDREQVFALYQKAQKIDAFTLPLVLDPYLEPWPKNGEKWIDLYHGEKAPQFSEVM